MLIAELCLKEADWGVRIADLEGSDSSQGQRITTLEGDNATNKANITKLTARTDIVAGTVTLKTVAAAVTVTGTVPVLPEAPMVSSDVCVEVEAAA